jgi:fluoride exporter
LNRFILVMVGGAIGSLARYAASSAIMGRVGGRFPLGTLTVNVSGPFLIGLLMVFFTERFAPQPNWRLFLAVGFLGGSIMFSSFEYESKVNEVVPALFELVEISLIKVRDTTIVKASIKVTKPARAV